MLALINKDFNKFQDISLKTCYQFSQCFSSNSIPPEKLVKLQALLANQDLAVLTDKFKKIETAAVIYCQTYQGNCMKK